MLVSLHSWRGEGEGGGGGRGETKRQRGKERRGDGKDGWQEGRRETQRRRGGASERERIRIDKFNGLGDRHAGDASQKALRTSFAEN